LSETHFVFVVKTGRESIANEAGENSTFAGLCPQCLQERFFGPFCLKNNNASWYFDCQLTVHLLTK